MRILFLSPYLPSPPIYGGQRRINGLITRLAASHTVSVVAFAYANEDYQTGIRLTEAYCQHVVAIPETWHRVAGRKKRILQLGSLLSTGSWERVLYKRESVQKALTAHLADHSYDAIVVEFAFMANYDFVIPHGAKRPVVILDEHNIEFDLLRRTADATGLVRRLFHAINWRKLRREELATWRDYDGCALASKRDEQLVREALPNVPTAVVPNGVDISYFAPMPELAPTPRTLVFFGAMNYYPNTEGAFFFVREVMPLLVRRFPDLRLRIVGDVGGSPVPELAGPNVQVVGFVDDVRLEIARAAAVVAPLRIGGGTRLKILEAMSMAKAIVATSIGAEGIEVAHGRDILLADSPSEQADAIAQVLDDRALAIRLGDAARATAVAGYSWEASASKLEAFIAERLAQRGP